MTALPKLPRHSVLVRTWFGADDAWESLVAEVETPSEDDFLANVMTVDDPAFAGLSVEALVAAQADENGPAVSFLADELTLTNGEHPILAVWVLGDDRPDREPFRVTPAALWSVENNINIGNMSWPEFTSAADEDGVFRGFEAPWLR